MVSPNLWIAYPPNISDGVSDDLKVQNVAHIFNYFKTSSDILYTTSRIRNH